MHRSALLPILDRFLEAAQSADKWRALKPAYKPAVLAIAEAFAVQGEALLGATPTQGSWLDTWDMLPDATANALLAPVQAAASGGLMLGAAAMTKQFSENTALSLKNPRAVAYLKEHGAQLIVGINDTTRSRIQTIVTNGADQGLSYTEIADQIAAEFAAFAPQRSIVDILLDKAQVRSRAEIVAITELGQAYEAGNTIVIDDLVAGGLKMEKKWLTVQDDKVDPDICAANAAQGWIPVEDAFQSGHMTPLGHVACRCSCLFRRVGAG